MAETLWVSRIWRDLDRRGVETELIGRVCRELNLTEEVDPVLVAADLISGPLHQVRLRWLNAPMLGFATWSRRPGSIVIERKLWDPGETPRRLWCRTYTRGRIQALRDLIQWAAGGPDWTHKDYSRRSSAELASASWDYFFPGLQAR